MMQRPVQTGPRLTKRARERKHEEAKAEAALGGAKLVENEDESAKKLPHWYVELQWFRLLRGQARLNQIARILVELAPQKVFDPRDVYSQSLKGGEAAEAAEGAEPAENAETAKAKKNTAKAEKPKKLSKKDQIIAANTAKMQKEAAARDAEKLRTLGASAGANIKLKTESGKLLLLLSILKKAVQKNNAVDTIDTMYEIEDVAKEVDPKEAKAAFKTYADIIKQASEMRSDRNQLGGLNLVDFQLTEMADRLPPLNLHSLAGKFKLDDWQLRVINLVNERKSVLITAPTSSGKTVLSTYVCTASVDRVLFVVPSEPLAWQVGAMLRALKVDISIVVPTLNFVPPKWNVCVGTPHSLESTLTKQIGFDFEYAVFDEVHSLNNDDGAALQRLIRAIPKSCKILALSATIGNSAEVVKWWESIVGEGEIELVDHKSRFINLQRYIWTGKSRSQGGASDGLMVLHPCASLSVEYLNSEEYKSSDIAFTPVDSYNLYKVLDALVVNCSVDVSDLKPKKFFATNGNSRITLMQAKDYEDALKDCLVTLAKKEPELCRLVLATLMPGADLKAVKKARKALLDKPKEEIKAFDSETGAAQANLLEKTLANSAALTSKESLADLCFDLQTSEQLPGICFQLDSVRCQGMFDGLLHELEERETAAHPDYRAELERRAKGLEKIKDKTAKKASKVKNEEEAAAEAQEFGELGSGDAVDVDTPHPDFVFTPPGRGMGQAETKDVIAKIGDDLPGTGEQAHPLIRGLRRGIGLYISGLPSSYHRVVQSFAQQGRLGIVFADELLAYGVNMPFRSCIFFGDSGEDWLTPLLHQQMSGRAGRRGLDRQGHLVYAGFSPSRLRSLLRGKLPDVIGKFPLYPTIPLQLDMNARYEVAGAKLDVNRMKQICATPLAEFLKGETIDDFYSIAEDWVDYLGILKHPESSYSHLIPELVWELRKYLPESLAIQYILHDLIRKFKAMVYGSPNRDADVSHQTSLFLVFCRICGRKPYSPELSEGDEQSGAWVKPLPFPHHEDEDWDEWTKLINESQERILNAPFPYKETMLLPVALDQPLDNLIYASFVRNQIDPSLPTPVQHDLRERVWNIGEILRITSNVLGRSSELQPVQNIIRKAFVRLRYILDETSQRNWKKLDAALALMPRYDDEEGEDGDGQEAAPPQPPASN